MSGRSQADFDRAVAESNTAGAPLFMADYDVTRAPEDDIALVRLATPLLPAEDVMGMVAFLDYKDTFARSVATAGYPFDRPTPPTTENPRPNDFKTLVETNGVVTYADSERFFFSEGMDAAAGQSGSGVWTTLDDSSDPLVAGVFTQVFATRTENSGRLITKDAYDSIVARMEADDGDANAARLPENTIVGTDSVFGLGGGDEIVGSYRKEQLLGQSGDDRMVGGGADDRIDGGTGTDEAVYANPVGEYLILPSQDPADGYEFVIGHVGGDGKDGVDRLKDVEEAHFADDFVVPLVVDPLDSTKLADGPVAWSSGAILDADGDRIGSAVAEMPTWSVDGDVRYSLLLGSEDAVSYNFVFVVDVSFSMDESATGVPPVTEEDHEARRGKGRVRESDRLVGGE